MVNKKNLTTGIDIVNINRIRNILEKKKQGFFNRVFTDREIQYILNTGTQATTVGGIFAAKEAIAKALGTGIGKIGWRDIEILHDEKGKPFTNIEGMVLSISHEQDYAIAIAIDYGGGIDIEITEKVKTLLPQRSLNTHKGTYGRVAIIGGSRGMTGAPFLSSQSALKAGSGLVYTIIPKSLETIMSIKLTEAIIRPVEDDNKGYFSISSLADIIKEIKDKDVIAIGPGIGVDDDRLSIIKEIIHFYKGPIVIDADAINCLSKEPDILLNNDRTIIITPHPGELAKLLGKSIKEIQEDRIYYSKYASEKYNIIVVLKGFNTIVSSPKGEIYVNTTGNPGMATAGSGDLLTGIIASFIGQGLKPRDGAQLGVFCHGLAGDLACFDKGEYGLVATDILENIPYSIKKIRG